MKRVITIAILSAFSVVSKAQDTLRMQHKVLNTPLANYAEIENIILKNGYTIDTVYNFKDHLEYLYHNNGDNMRVLVVLDNNANYNPDFKIEGGKIIKQVVIQAQYLTSVRLFNAFFGTSYSAEYLNTKSNHGPVTTPDNLQAWRHFSKMGNKQGYWEFWVKKQG